MFGLVLLRVVLSNTDKYEYLEGKNMDVITAKKDSKLNNQDIAELPK